nr:NADH-quinone oxidoreductase subunit H [Pseudobdellovibrionaceae bacterium]
MQDFIKALVTILLNDYVKLIVIFMAIVQMVPILVWVERRGSAFIQNRLGPNRVGPLGLLQLLADAVKFLRKEDFVPAAAVKFLFYMAPVYALIPGAIAFSAIPLSLPIQLESFEFMGASFSEKTLIVQGYDIGIGIVFILGVSSLAAYTILMAGWGSGSKFSLMGALRASAQTISYELALGLSIVGLILVYGTYNLNEMIYAQAGPLTLNLFGYQISTAWIPNWGIFYQPIALVLFFTASFAESNRLPFDLAEGESELVAGFHTEYGGFKMLMFFIGEYGHMMIASALMVVFFFGGYLLPLPGFTPDVVARMLSEHFDSASIVSIVNSLIHLMSFGIKFLFFLWVFIWVRWTLPRFRYDQLMDLGWKTMLPWGLFNTILTAFLVFFAR